MNQAGRNSTRPVALVTGASRGIGRGAALALATRGFDLALVDLAATSEAMEVTRGQAHALGAHARFIAADIARLDVHARIVVEARERTGTIDVLVNNAGISVARRGDVLEVTPESFDRVLGVNLRGTFFLTQAVARCMLEAAPPRHPRAIVTVTSANAVMVAPDRAEYCFSKTALSMAVKVFALRLAEAGIACYEVRPGIIRTDMTRVAAEKYDRLIAAGITPIARWGEPEDVGRTIACLAAGDLPFVTGDAVHVDGGLHIHKL
ncbi:MAG TPA: 3-ketoacyl-ACP reductase [Casimicrobiaceae bacterium]|nr:3-ketoacyl-ACP reductase [Casimicrobiaceae bacterium]